jgi:hypothetical protein
MKRTDSKSKFKSKSKCKINKNSDENVIEENLKTVPSN